MLNITLLAALPDEYRCFKRLTGGWRLVCRRPFREFARTDPAKQLHLVETGMGQKRITAALNWIMQEAPPDMLCSFGFAGGLSRELRVGQVVCGARFSAPHAGRDGVFPETIAAGGCAEALADFCHTHGVMPAEIVTDEQPREKCSVMPGCGDLACVMDMESWFIARFAQQEGIPLICFRAVSDGLGDEITFDLDEITTEGRVTIAKVVRLLAKHPRLLPEFYALWKNSTRAARELARVVSGLVDIPSFRLERMASQCRGGRE